MVISAKLVLGHFLTTLEFSFVFVNNVNEKIVKGDCIFVSNFINQYYGVIFRIFRAALPPQQ